MHYNNFVMENKNITIEKIEKAIEAIVEEKTKDLATRKEVAEFKDLMLTAMDKQNKKLDLILTEHPAMNHAIDENREEIEQQDKRIKILEAHPAIA
ncbi:MAG: hypothetical protein CO042_00285 [Parcubacteria group bacterium CG_4_9_14_0_2_um_filter_41_8]|nr:MAG: hypothetical protein AUJ34_01765 [Parcubacteria group bacterium CG1_02_41_12]PIP67340.1 MAG: hypothetical protein COW93_00690 [Parcubacteria group bacterium CG22_combo_CG10-13_8_21_14_all_41_9]PIQ80069.1 MAG: hypothetical protein COV79_02450 [Parcubacteria group bacterium CG11_big_fil_rev_8_21_14_0_20_41_14]PIZ78977.1 MAG: hypothetical protein COY02_03935 [Parcubacteria group bacterium CG_4_10_14_0_2_um_filter_41_6]PJC41092.1 MAG: hypothetical protein CO042_00285 [Parcubacteria group ba